MYNKYILNVANAQALFKHFHKDLIQVLNELLTSCQATTVHITSPWNTHTKSMHILFWGSKQFFSPTGHSLDSNKADMHIHQT